MLTAAASPCRSAATRETPGAPRPVIRAVGRDPGTPTISFGPIGVKWRGRGPAVRGVGERLAHPPERRYLSPGPPSLAPVMRRFLLPLLVPLALLACRSARPDADASASAPPPDLRPLNAFAGQRVAVLPAQRLRPADTAAWGGRVPPGRGYLVAFDSALAAQLGERGLATVWALAADVERAAKRNATYAADPRALAVNALLPRKSAPPEDLTEPLATQLRTLVALTDARYALVPVELRFERGATGQGRAVLRAALLDARGSSVTWFGDVVGDSSLALSPALAASPAARLADLIAAP